MYLCLCWIFIFEIIKLTNITTNFSQNRSQRGGIRRAAPKNTRQRQKSIIDWPVIIFSFDNILSIFKNISWWCVSSSVFYLAALSRRSYFYSPPVLCWGPQVHTVRIYIAYKETCISTTAEISLLLQYFHESFSLIIWYVLWCIQFLFIYFFCLKNFDLPPSLCFVKRD